MEYTQPIQRHLPLDVVWVVLGKFGNISCSAPACLLVAFSEILRKLILAQISQQQLSSGKEIIIHLHDMPNVTNAGLYNVLAFIQNGQIKFLEPELENILIAANDLQVVSLVSLICEEMTARILENTSTAIPLLYIVVACLPPRSQYRNMVVDVAAKKFRTIIISSEFRKISFEMLYALISSPMLQEAEWVMEIYKAILFWLRNNIEQIYLAPALLDNVNFKLIINMVENDDLILSPRHDQSLSSSVYTISGAETVNAPTPIRGPIGLAPSPLCSFIIPAFESTSPLTTRSLNTETSISMDKNWCPIQKHPAESDNLSDYQTIPTVMHTAQESTASKAGNSERRLWSEVLVEGLKHTSRNGNVTSEIVSVQDSTTSPTSPTVPLKSPHDSIPTTIAERSAPIFTYAAAASGQKETETAVGSSSVPESIGIQTSSSQESASSSKRRRKFEQIPLRTEPPKSRKELRKERQARERAAKN
ncbi:hypothetical protein DINM_006703 [Dirofilaria immitis]|nr:hypothetical protein [Dirofilaria immitis]